LIDWSQWLIDRSFFSFSFSSQFLFIPFNFCFLKKVVLFEDRSKEPYNICVTNNSTLWPYLIVNYIFSCEHPSYVISWYIMLRYVVLRVYKYNDHMVENNITTNIKVNQHQISVWTFKPQSSTKSSRHPSHITTFYEWKLAHDQNHDGIVYPCSCEQPVSVSCRDFINSVNTLLHTNYINLVFLAQSIIPINDNSH